MAQQDAYVGLARKWRPQAFEDLIGQEAVRQSFQKTLTQGRVAHGHLLAGPRGVGKTTSARILAKALNCEQGPTATPCGKCSHCIAITTGNDLDVIEIDAASNTGVQQMREILERVVQSPFSSRFKVYIIDEIHMLSIQAFNALLKTLEEPPPHVIFIFATTELEKVPETVKSRCVLHAFRRLTAEDIITRLDQVAQGEGAQMDPATAREIYGAIARSVEGGMRDALVLFDQLLALTDGKPDVESTLKLLGLADRTVLVEATKWLATPGENESASQLLALVDDLVTRGRSLERFVRSLVSYLRDLMLLQAGADASLVTLSGDALAAAREQARDLTPTALFNILNHMFELEEKLKGSTQARFLLEFTLLRLAAVRPVVPIDEIMRRIQAVPDQAFAPVSGAATGNSSAGTSSGASPGIPSGVQTARIESIHGSGTSKPGASRVSAVAPEGSRIAAVMNDSAPSMTRVGTATLDISTSTPASAAVQSTVKRMEQPPSIEFSPMHGEELIEKIVPELPDASRFLERYLRQAAALVMEDTGLEIAWSEGSQLGRRMVERPENARVIEASLLRLTGRAMRLRSVTSSEPSDSLKSEHVANAPTPAGPSLADRAAMRAEMMPGDDAVPEPPGQGEDEAYDLENTSQSLGVIESMDGPSIVSDDPSTPLAIAGLVAPIIADHRTAKEKAQAFLARGGEVARRAKMLREMFHGRSIDEYGQPLSS